MDTPMETRKRQKLAEINRRFADIGGYRGIQCSSYEGGLYTLAEQYAALVRKEGLVNPVQFASFDHQILLCALESIPDPEKQKEFLVAHQRGLDALLDRKNLDVVVKVDLDLDLQEICSDRLAVHLYRWVERIIAKDRAVNMGIDTIIGHSYGVAEYMAVIGEYTGVADTYGIAVLKLAGLFHDLGKTGVPNGILGKQGPLDEGERVVMNKHVDYSERFIEAMEEETSGSDDRHTLRLIKSPIGDHHEKVDGSGYSRGRKGDEISEVGRMLALADAYDAMTTRRVYRPALSSEIVRHEILVKGKGRQFDPALCTEGLFERLEARRLDRAA
jgi:HD-GYP domain-containing protein (c-di-GMP phosphodiesterase class II)